MRQLFFASVVAALAVVGFGGHHAFAAKPRHTVAECYNADIACTKWCAKYNSTAASQKTCKDKCGQNYEQCMDQTSAGGVLPLGGASHPNGNEQGQPGTRPQDPNGIGTQPGALP